MDKVRTIVITRWYTIKCDCGHNHKHAIGITGPISSEIYFFCKKCNKQLNTGHIIKHDYGVER